MMGGNFADADAWEIALLSNDEVLAVNQDAAARQGHRVSSKEGLELWLRDLQDGSRALALFNRTDDDARIRAALAELGLTGRFHVRDIWQRKDLPATDSLVEVFVPSHGAALLRLTKAD
jgi:alpha-galactosidase